MTNHFPGHNPENVDEAIKLIDQLREKITLIPATPESGSDLANDEIATIPPVHPAQLVSLMLANAWSCLDSAREIYQPGSNRRITAIETLLRTALIASARAAFILIPEDPKERQDNATRVAYASFQSGQRAWNELGNFKHLIDDAQGGKRVFDDVFEYFNDKKYPRGEEKLIKDMLKLLVPYLQDSGDEDFLYEYLLLMWHGYSGVAHANHWQFSLSQHLMEGSGSIAVGDITSNLLTVAQVADYSVDLYYWKSIDRKSRMEKS
ncbi:hypothetical protein [Glutamicibacter sp.]|uniref:hypothetical protein n=1 Tax=Glutamicibacter sp. TaxID=1931995 RepID=UPI003D6B8209